MSIFYSNVGYVNCFADLYGAPLLQCYFRRILGNDIDRLCIVSPDAGGAKRADFTAEEMNADLAIISKKRERVSNILKNKYPCRNAFQDAASCLKCVEFSFRWGGVYR